MQRFSGGGSEAKLGEWKLQIETILSFQPLSDSQKVDCVRLARGGGQEGDFDFGQDKQEYPQENISYSACALW